MTQQLTGTAFRDMKTGDGVIWRNHFRSAMPNEATARASAASATMLEALKATRKWMGDRPSNPTTPYDISAAMIIEAQELAIRLAETGTVELSDTVAEARAIIQRSQGEAAKAVNESDRVNVPGHIEPETMRFCMTIEDFQKNMADPDHPAWLYLPDAADMGLEPWRRIDGINPHARGGLTEIWLDDGSLRDNKPMNTPIYVQQPFTFKGGATK